jgi:hypothetical protein
LSAEGSAFGNLSENGTGCFFLMLVKYLLAFSLRICSSQRNITWQFSKIYFGIGIKRHTLETVSSDGVPKRSVIRSNWWTTFFPGNKGFPVKISAKMQPILHMSIAGEYCIEQQNKYHCIQQNKMEGNNKAENNSQLICYVVTTNICRSYPTLAACTQH